MNIPSDLFEGYSEGELLPDPRTSYAPIPKKLISVLVKRGIVSVPVTPEQDAGLKMLQWAWEDESKLVMRFLIGSIRKRDRKLLLLHPQMGRIERYIYSLFKNKSARTIASVQDMVKKFYNVEYPAEEIKIIRKKVYNDMSKDKRADIF